nr:hypothetical protein [Tanacetum cinerariifolium]
VGNKVVHKELGDRMERAATTASSLEAEQDNGSGPRCQDTILGEVEAHTRFEAASKQFNDPPLSREAASASTLKDGKIKITSTIDGRIKTISEASIRRHLKLEDSDGITTLPNTEIFKQFALREEPATMAYDSPLPRVQSLRSINGSLTLNELVVLCTKLSKRVEDLQSDLQQTKQTYGAAYTKLILRVKKLEQKVKTSQHRKRTRVVISNDKEDLEDPSKQGRKIAEINENPSISLVQDEGTLRIQKDSEIQGGLKKSKKQLEQERVRYEEAIRFQEKILKEERQRIARDAKIAKQLQEAIADAALAHDIDWNDHAILRYHALQNRSFSKAKVRKNMCTYLKNQEGYKQSYFKGMSYEDIRPIFERVWDQIHAFVPIDFEIEKEVMKKSGFDLQQKQFAKKVSKKKDDISRKQVGGSRKKQLLIKGLVLNLMKKVLKDKS